EVGGLPPDIAEEIMKEVDGLSFDGSGSSGAVERSLDDIKAALRGRVKFYEFAGHNGTIYSDWELEEIEKSQGVVDGNGEPVILFMFVRKDGSGKVLHKRTFPLDVFHKELKGHVLHTDVTQEVGGNDAGV
ncbi:MAG: hypothetical protein V1656_03550, partial [Candidatus Jorgensenbacteria bacterium]